jgi:hypothetical protein
MALIWLNRPENNRSKLDAAASVTRQPWKENALKRII